MRVLQIALAIIACLILSVQTVRHGYLLWFQPRTSVLDKYDKPLNSEIALATSVDELLRKYQPFRAEVDKIKATHRADDPKSTYQDESDTEPFKSEQALRQAIVDWEEKSKEIHALKFYWFVGLLFVTTGLFIYKRKNPWLGLVGLIIGFSEFVYWTSPSFMGESTREYDRLLMNKFTFSFLSILVLGVVLISIRAFQDKNSVHNQ